jgi:1-acyl-sn-glycerol-3-phosphate acyltransferase
MGISQRIAYDLLKLLFGVGLRIFYRRLSLEGDDYRRTKGPFIVVSNHPNTLMDALIVAVHLKQRIGFLGNASLFRHPVSASLMRFFSVIPIYRKQDLQEGESMDDNERSFQKAHEHLNAGGAFLVFPEGTSIKGRKLRDIRTGTARIGLGYEFAEHFGGGLKILPVSINYSSSTRFRSEVHVNFNPPIIVSEYRNLHEQDPREAVRKLTEEISERLTGGLVSLEDEGQERMFSQIMDLLISDPSAKGLSATNRFRLEKKISTNLAELVRNSPESYKALQSELEQWNAMTDQLAVRIQTLGRINSRISLMIKILNQVLALGLSLPVWLVGIMTSYLPYRLTGWLPKKIVNDIEYHAPVAMVLGMLIFPCLYGIEAGCIWLFAPADWSGGWFFMLWLLLPVCGWLTLHAITAGRNLRAMLQLLFLIGTKGGFHVRLVQEQSELRKKVYGLTK